MGVFGILSSAVPEQVQVLIHEFDGEVKTHIMKVDKHWWITFFRVKMSPHS